MSISREKMFEIDNNAIENHKINPIILMENAALGIFNEINKYGSYTIVCGSGNNGGDGLALARHLLIDNKIVDVYLTGEPQTKEAKENLESVKTLTENIYYINNENDLLNLIDSLEVNEVCIDAIFGIGLSRDIEGIFNKVITSINEHSNYTISIDVPSGIDANTGQILNNSIRADETMAIYDVKDGMVNNEFCGKISIIYLGVPKL